MFFFDRWNDYPHFGLQKRQISAEQESRKTRWILIEVPGADDVVNSPFPNQPRRNGKIPKLLQHRLFPQAEYLIWMDGKLAMKLEPFRLLQSVGLVDDNYQPVVTIV